MQGIKHLVQCRCILPQFKRVQNPPRHQFVVFSIINDDNIVNKKYVQCPNCGVIHKVQEISKSEIQEGKEHMSSIITVDEIRNSIDENIAAILESNHAEIPLWEEVEYITSTPDEWGRAVVLNKDTDGDELHVKYLRILSSKLFKVFTETEELFVKGETDAT